MCVGVGSIAGLGARTLVAHLAVVAEDGSLALVDVVELGPPPRLDVVLTQDTKGEAYLEEVHELHVVLEPTFFRHNPSGGERREGAPVVLRGELGRRVGADEEFEEVAVGIRVVQTSHVGEHARLAASEVGVGRAVG